MSAAAFELFFVLLFSRNVSITITMINQSSGKRNSLATLHTNVKSQLSVKSYRKWLHLCDLIC